MNDKMLFYLGNSLFIISPCIGYIPQIISGNIVFSPLLSLMLILASISKFYFYQAEQFSKVILAQSFFLIFVQFFLIYNFTSSLGFIEEKFYKKIESKRYSFFYLNVFIVFLAFLGLHSISMINESFYATCGIISSVIESSVGVMQIFLQRMDKKYKSEDKEPKRRLPKELFICWIVGDILKLYWMYKLVVPVQITAPIIFQIVIDFVLLFQ
ncbi:hypothetical protein GVAV_001970 [Gurleya vavrai]